LDLGVQLHSSISEHEHGKGIPDGSANLLAGMVEKGCAYGHHALYLAQVHPKPLTPPTKRIGYYDASLRGGDKDFKMHTNSKLLHYQQKPSLATELT
jgi:hypothetical protein